jgi:hypothetical protein
MMEGLVFTDSGYSVGTSRPAMTFPFSVAVIVGNSSSSETPEIFINFG